MTLLFYYNIMVCVMLNKINVFINDCRVSVRIHYCLMLLQKTNRFGVDLVVYLNKASLYSEKLSVNILILIDMLRSMIILKSKFFLNKYYKVN